MAGRFSVEAVFKAVDKMSAPVNRMSKNITKFTRGAERSFRRLDGAISRVGSAIGKGIRVGIAGATVALTALGLALNKTAKDADMLAKQSRRLEFPVEELQEWRFVAEQSGIGAEEFSKGIEKLAKGVGEARAGTGTLVTILRKTNPVLLEQLQRTTNVADATDLYIKAIRETPDAMDRAALATAAFGRSGSKFINIAEQSEEAIKRLRMEQIENGIITKEQAEAAEAYNDALNSLKRAGMGFVQGVLLPMMPMLTEVIRSMREWVVANRELIAGKTLEFFTKIVDNFDEIIERLTFFAKAIAIFFAFATALKTVIAVLTVFNLVASLNPIGLIVLGVVAAIAAFAALVTWIDKVLELFDGLPGPIRAVMAPLRLLLGLIKFTKDAFNEGVVAAGGKFVSGLARFAGFGDDEETATQPTSSAPQIISKESRMKAALAEITGSADIRILDDSGRAEVVEDNLGAGTVLTLERTGAF